MLKTKWRFLAVSFLGALLVGWLPGCTALPALPDGDGDGIPDLIDPCPTNPDPTCVPSSPPSEAYDCDNPPAVAGKFVPVSRPIAGRYIVVLRPQDGRALGLEKVRDLAEAFGVSDLQAFNPKVLSGFSAQISDLKTVARLVLDERVRYVQQDGAVSIPRTIKAAAASIPWNLDRSDQRDLPLDSKYEPAQDGDGVAIYDLDTGCPSTDLTTCRQDHPDFGSRLQSDCFSTIVFQGCYDAHGHGTHTMGTAGGSKFGIAKNVKLYGVRFLDANGSGSDSDGIKALQWIVNHNPGEGVRKVNTNSWGGPPAPALDEAVCNAIKAGVVVIAAAGNSSEDSRNGSPGRIKQVITVGAADKGDAFAYFSSFGPGVDLTAGGVDVESDTPSGGSATMSGTSMATPAVAGAAALYLQRHPAATPAEVEAGLVAEASAGKLKSLPAETPNLLLWVPPQATGGATPPKTHP